MPGPEPAGIDIRDAAEFKWIEGEVRRMDAGGPTGVDWNNVGTLSLNILAKQSKDILVACWATMVCFGSRDMRVLLAALASCAARWRRIGRGYFSPIGSLVALVRAVAGIVPIAADSPAVVAAYDALDDLARPLSGKLVQRAGHFGGDAPGAAIIIRTGYVRAGHRYQAWG
ncbi:MULTISPECIES: type VI secretion system ImpA family N-terminal domain-containing protein [unclassified Bradyrhizobium]|uniref:type VI secretion system ImpA family N-terminal domain-containing protein n=1 Tax=unclassified Bradyrhizobium TaxID=2631580 RepID=UPI003D232ED9